MQELGIPIKYYKLVDFDKLNYVFLIKVNTENGFHMPIINIERRGCECSHICMKIDRVAVKSLTRF